MPSGEYILVIHLRVLFRYVFSITKYYLHALCILTRVISAPNTLTPISNTLTPDSP